MTLIKLGVSFASLRLPTIVILDNLGVNVTGLIAGLGVGGIAIGLAAQGIFSDLFAAISIIFDRPFKRGDTITYGTTTARVEKIGMKSTRLRAFRARRRSSPTASCSIGNHQQHPDHLSPGHVFAQPRPSYAARSSRQKSPPFCRKL